MILIDGFTEASVDTLAKDLNLKMRELQQEIDDELKKSKENCSSTILSEKEFEKIVSDFLKGNFTVPSKQKVQSSSGNQTKSSSTKKNDESFLGKLKKKIFAFVRDSKNESPPEARLKRCMGVDKVDLTFEEENLKLDSSNVEDFKIFMRNLVECLGKVNKSEEGNEAGETSTDQSKILDLRFRRFSSKFCLFSRFSHVDHKGDDRPCSKQRKDREFASIPHTVPASSSRHRSCRLQVTRPDADSEHRRSDQKLRFF